MRNKALKNRSKMALKRPLVEVMQQIEKGIPCGQLNDEDKLLFHKSVSVSNQHNGRL